MPETSKAHLNRKNAENLVSFSGQDQKRQWDISIFYSELLVKTLNLTFREGGRSRTKEFT